tara:strand:- start:76 stop:294 length:219 start_codon:yes stop_codon:yes gene_type:complete
MNSLIRKISIGSDSQNQYHISVGSTVAGSTVYQIIEITPTLFEIWHEHPKGGHILWKKISNMPVIVEYDTRS